MEITRRRRRMYMMYIVYVCVCVCVCVYIGVYRCMCFIVVPRSTSSDYIFTKRALEPVVAVRLPTAFSSRLTLGAACQTHARAHTENDMKIIFFL